MLDAGKRGSERPPHVHSGDVRRQEAPTVIGLPQPDDLAPPGVQKRHVNGRLDRLGPRVREERLAQPAGAISASRRAASTCGSLT